jgi:hypothetical protein
MAAVGDPEPALPDEPIAPCDCVDPMKPGVPDGLEDPGAPDVDGPPPWVKPRPVRISRQVCNST